MRPDQQELAAIIEEETDRLSRLVTEAVKMAEIDAGKAKPRRAPAPAAEFLEAARESFEGRGAERLRIAPAGDPRVLVDRDLMVLAVRQVFDNALKYSDPGSPVVCETAEEPDRLLIRIIDQGPGIRESDRERIFDKFYRRAGVRGQVPGSGLGLHIAREIARIHGGDLWVEPAGGQQGAVFCFSLPTKPGEAEA
jgi:signal transduction histidine kinase